MYSKIMLPVDLKHKESQEKAVIVAVDLARLYGANICLVGVTTSAPTSVANSEEDFNKILTAYAHSKSIEHNVQIDHQTIHSNDPTVDLDDALVKACEETHADLVVMASHVPVFMEHFFRYNASRLVTHTSISVLIVR